jgi:hypothetical protein
MTLIFSRRRSVTSCRNRAFSSWSSAIRSSSARVRSGSLAFGVTTNAHCGPGGALCHRCKVMTLTPSVRAISRCSFPCVANSSACANFVAISTLECLFLLGIAACIRPPPYVVPQISFCALGAAQRIPYPTMATNYRVADLTRGVRPLCGAQVMKRETCVGEIANPAVCSKRATLLGAANSTSHFTPHLPPQILMHITKCEWPIANGLSKYAIFAHGSEGHRATGTIHPRVTNEQKISIKQKRRMCRACSLHLSVLGNQETVPMLHTFIPLGL